jgi:hypothetical protein
LELLAEGKITAAEAIERLDRKSPAAAKEPVENLDPLGALKADELASLKVAAEPPIDKELAKKSEDFNIVISEDDLKSPHNGDRPRWLKIRVRDLESGRNKVSVTLPLGLVNFGLGIARRFGADLDEEFDSKELWQMLKEGQRGVLIDVEDEEDNEQVQIYLD